MQKIVPPPPKSVSRQEMEAFAPNIVARFQQAGVECDNDRITKALSNVGASYGSSGARNALTDPVYMLVDALRNTTEPDGEISTFTRPRLTVNNFEHVLAIASQDARGEEVKQRLTTLGTIVSKTGLKTADELSEGGKLQDKEFMGDFEVLVDGTKRRFTEMPPSDTGNDDIGQVIAKVAVAHSTRTKTSSVGSSLNDPIYGVAETLKRMGHYHPSVFIDALEAASRCDGWEREALIGLPSALRTVEGRKISWTPENIHNVLLENRKSALDAASRKLAQQ